MQEPEHSEANQTSPVMRKCQLCGEEKDLEQFYWSQGKRMTRCKECHKNYVKMWRKHHREQVLEHRKRYNDKYRARRKDAAKRSTQADG